MRYSSEHLQFLESATDEMEALELDESTLEAEAAQAASAATVQAKVCSVYQKVRPFLLLVGNLFFIPAKWKTAINGFIQTMDLVCPAG